MQPPERPQLLVRPLFGDGNGGVVIADDELAQVAQAGGDDIEYRRGADGLGILHQPRGAEAGCAPDGAGIGRELAGEDLQERRLAGAIPSDDRDALTGLDEEGGMIEKRNMAERRRHVFQGNQWHLPAIPPPPLNLSPSSANRTLKLVSDP